MSDTGSLLEAMLAVQDEAPTLTKDATNPHFRSKYAPLDTIVETISPILTRHGLVWTAMPSFDETTGEPTLRYELAHAPSKERMAGEMKLLLSKGDPQGQGSAITYARRYALVSVLNLVADDDDDGNAASGGYGQQRRSKPAAKPAPDPAHVAEVKRLVRQHGVKAGSLRLLLREVGVDVPEGGNVITFVERLEPDQAAALSERIARGVIPTGVSDVPSGDLPWEPGPPVVEGADPEDEVPAGTRQFDVGPS